MNKDYVNIPKVIPCMVNKIKQGFISYKTNVNSINSDVV